MEFMGGLRGTVGISTVPLAVVSPDSQWGEWESLDTKICHDQRLDNHPNCIRDYGGTHMQFDF